jgi:hypothetical protein
METNMKGVYILGVSMNAPCVEELLVANIKVMLQLINSLK